MVVSVGIESQNLLGWKGPIRITESSSCPDPPRITVCLRAWCCDHSLGGLFWCPTTFWVKNPVNTASKLCMNEFVSTLWTACECVWSEVSDLMVTSDHQAFSSVCFGSGVVQSIFKLRRNPQNLNIFVLADNKTVVNHWIFEQIKWNWSLSLFECVLDIKLTIWCVTFGLKWVCSPAKHCFAVTELLIP